MKNNFYIASNSNYCGIRHVFAGKYIDSCCYFTVLMSEIAQHSFPVVETQKRNLYDRFMI